MKRSTGVRADRVEQDLRPLDVRRHELRRALLDRLLDVRLGRGVDDVDDRLLDVRLGRVTITSTARASRRVADVAVDEREPLVAHHVGEVLEVARVGERVERDDVVAVCASRWRMKFDEMNPAPPVTRTRFAHSSSVDRVERPSFDLALDSAQVLADQREDEALDAEHEEDGDAAEQRAREVRAVDPVADAVDRRAPVASSVQTTPSATPIHWIGCGQKPASTCSASRVRRSGE